MLSFYCFACAAQRRTPVTYGMNLYDSLGGGWFQTHGTTKFVWCLVTLVTLVTLVIRTYKKTLPIWWTSSTNPISTWFAVFAGCPLVWIFWFLDGSSVLFSSTTPSVGFISAHLCHLCPYPVRSAANWTQAAGVSFVWVSDSFPGCPMVVHFSTF